MVDGHEMVTDARVAELEGLLRDREQEARTACDVADYWKAECQKARRIVTDLAALECPVETIVSYVTGDVEGLCPTCHATLSADEPHLIEPHEAGCVLVRAREAVGDQARTTP